MMTNREIAKTFQLLAKMMELHGENEFRIRAYRTAYDALKRLDHQMSEMSTEEIRGVKGIGNSTGEKIEELINKGSMERFDQYARKTPEGIRELLMIKGLGAGKVKAIWKEMGIETPGELLYACNENRLVEFSGFGLKTQADIRKQLEYYLDSDGKFLWAAIEPAAERILQSLRAIAKGRVEWVGEFARKCAVVQHLECLAEGDIPHDELSAIPDMEVANTDAPFSCMMDELYKFTLHLAPPKEYDQRRLVLTGDTEFIEFAKSNTIPSDLPPELMEGEIVTHASILDSYKDLIEVGDLKGIIHAHSTESDGLHSLREMALYTRDAGFEYLCITDHSRSAVYARGLTPERVLAQWDEIDKLNAELAPFRIFKGIESDILSDGALDYEDEILAGFDLVIASVHSGLKMDEGKATQRLIRAIENPHTKVLGHPTGRLLLARQGYPIDHRKVIEACAANGVSIEVNANPQRLDMDASWIPYALEKGVLIAINPDAHSRESIHNVRFGVNVARKGGLIRSMCLTAKTREEILSWMSKK